MMPGPPNHPTSYADVNLALHDFEVRIQAILKDRFLGMYLTGSLALGDFDPRTSDIDFVVVTDAALSEEAIAALKELHAHFDAGGSPWAGKVEAVYVPQDALRRYPPPPALYPQFESDRGLFLDHLEGGWIFQCYILREHGVVLSGPNPRTLIPPVDPDDMRRAAAPIAGLWLQQAHEDPSWLDWARQRGNQAFVVLTLCRLLYTRDTGGVTSKPGAARWASDTLDSRWTGLIERSIAGQRDTDDTPESDMNEMLALVEYTVDRFKEWSA